MWRLVYGRRVISIVDIHCDSPSQQQPVVNFRLYSRYGIYLDKGTLKISDVVCKQYWHETTQVFFDATTFYFYNTELLHHLCVTPSLSGLASRMQRIRIGSRLILDATSREYYWYEEFNPAGVGMLSALEGLEWIIWHSQDGSFDISECIDVLHEPLLKKLDLPEIIAGFQQHKLRPEMTSVKLRRIRATGVRDSVESLEDAIREQLLQHKPPKGVVE